MSSSPLYDVFISHSSADSILVRRLETRLNEVNLVTYRHWRSSSDPSVQESMRSALGESRVLVVVLSPRTRRSSMVAVEVGAAMAWQKHIFVLMNNLSQEDVPAFLATYPIYTSNQIRELAEKIKRSAEPLDDVKKTVLLNLYGKYNVPSDQLARKVSVLEDLTIDFNHKTSSVYSPERVLQELIRMRKLGELRVSKNRKSSGSSATKNIKTSKSTSTRSISAKVGRSSSSAKSSGSSAKSSSNESTRKKKVSDRS